MTLALGAFLVHSSITSADGFRDSLQHSDIVLMPGWEYRDVNTVSPLNPSVVAWGEDAVWGTAERKKNAAKYRQMGVDLLAANVWMLTATKEKLVESEPLMNATCLDIEGARIVPSWLSDDTKPVRPYWGCTNQTAFRQQLRERARNGILAGANMLHLDDHMGTAAAAEHSGGCFCDACMRGFREWLQANYSEQALKALGIGDIQHFDYAALIKSAGLDTREKYDANVKQLPLREEFLAFQRSAVADLVAELKAIAAEAHGAPVPLGINSWNLGPTHMSNAHIADYFSNEVKHFGVEKEHPPFVYKLADALDKPVFSTATGDGWSKVNAGEESERVRHWLAMSYVFGHQFMYAFRQWAFDPESGTSWYEPPVSVYQPITDFISANKNLFDGYESFAKIGVLYSNKAMAEGDERVRALTQKLHENSVQFRLLAAGDIYLQKRLQKSDAEGLDYICVVPNQLLPDGQQTIVDDWIKAGIAGDCTEKDFATARIVVKQDGEVMNDVWALLRMRDQKSAVLHLFNQAIEAKGGAPIAQENLTIQIPETLLGRVRHVTVHAPRLEEQKIKTKRVKLGNNLKAAEFGLDKINRWAVVELN